MGTDKVVTLSAMRHYIDLPYHNWGHAVETRERALDLADRCVRHGIPVDRFVVKTGAEYHDAEYFKDHLSLGFPTKEALSAHVAGTDLIALMYDFREVRAVEETIMGTEPDAMPRTVEQKIVRAADLFALAGEYPRLVRNSGLLKQEREMLTGRSISEEEWALATRKALEFYLGQDIRLTPEHDGPDGNSLFHAGMRENLERYVRER